MAKLFAVTIIVIAIASAIPIVLHIWEPPVDISTHGHADRRADVGDHGGGRRLLPGRATRSGILHLEILQSSEG